MFEMGHARVAYEAFDHAQPKDRRWVDPDRVTSTTLKEAYGRQRAGSAFVVDFST